MPSITLRPAVETDIAAITEIYADAVLRGTASYEVEPPKADEMTRRFRSLAERGFPYLVAEVGGAVAGYAYVGPFRERPAYRYVVENSVYVAPRAKGMGVGRRLLDRLIDETAARGYRQMIAVIGDGGDDNASVRLHKATGFTHAGTIGGSGFKHGRWLDTMIMQLAMNGGTATLPE